MGLKKKYLNYITKDLLINEYLINKLSQAKIAKKYNVSSGVILTYLNFYNILKRSHSEALTGRVFTEEHKRKIALSQAGEKGNNYIDGRESNPNFCEDCGISISPKATRCYSCFSENNTGNNNSGFKGGLPNCIDCGKKLSAYHCLRCLKCNKNFYKGRLHPRFGKIAAHSKIIWDKNICFRSSWEFLFAKWCDLSNIKWLHEPRAFDLGNTTYTPDFYLPEFDLWIEIKGYWRDDAKKKFNKFKRLFKEINIEVFEKNKLSEIGVL